MAGSQPGYVWYNYTIPTDVQFNQAHTNNVMIEAPMLVPFNAPPIPPPVEAPPQQKKSSILIDKRFYCTQPEKESKFHSTNAEWKICDLLTNRSFDIAIADYTTNGMFHVDPPTFNREAGRLEEFLRYMSVRCRKEERVPFRSLFAWWKEKRFLVDELFWIVLEYYA